MWKFFHIWAILISFQAGIETHNSFVKVFWSFIVVLNIYFLVEYHTKKKDSPPT